MIAFIEKKDPSLCCGCGACVSICTHNALSFHINDEGYKEPVLNEKACVNCNLCDKVCPIMNADKVQKAPQLVYAAINKKQEILKSSSSGGVFSVIAEYVLENEGVVYGAAFDKSMTLKHIRITQPVELNKLRGSKYLQSDTEGIFKMAKEDLRNGKMVYFTGVPCQVAGLKLFLRKDYNNLFTTDIVCHGVPSQKIFDVFINHFREKRNVEITNYKFRDKRVNGWSCSSSSSCKKNGSDRIFEVYFDKTLNAYMNAFLSGSIDRESCYKCPFAKNERVGDITLADYWGVKKFHPEINCKLGVSLTIVNTDSGKEMFCKLKDYFSLVQSQLEWAASENPNLVHPTPRPKDRSNVFEYAFENPDEFIKRYTDKQHIRKSIKFALKRFVKSNPWLYRLLVKFK